MYVPVGSSPGEKLVVDAPGPAQVPVVLETRLIKLTGASCEHWLAIVPVSAAVINCDIEIAAQLLTVQPLTEME